MHCQMDTNKTLGLQLHASIVPCCRYNLFRLQVFFVIWQSLFLINYWRLGGYLMFKTYKIETTSQLDLILLVYIDLYIFVTAFDKQLQTSLLKLHFAYLSWSHILHWAIQKWMLVCRVLDQTVLHNIHCSPNDFSRI